MLQYPSGVYNRPLDVPRPQQYQPELQASAFAAPMSEVSSAGFRQQAPYVPVEFSKTPEHPARQERPFPDNQSTSAPAASASEPPSVDQTTLERAMMQFLAQFYPKK